MLKYAYQLGVEAAFRDAGIEKDAWLKELFGKAPSKGFSAWKGARGVLSPAQKAREAGFNAITGRGRHALARGI